MAFPAREAAARASAGPRTSRGDGGRVQSISRGRGPGGEGKTASSSLRSSSVRWMSRAAWFCRTCSGVPALGMAMTSSSRSTQARATWAGGRPMPGGHRVERGVADQPALLDRRVGHGRDAAFAAPGQQVVFDAAPGEVVEDLVGLYGAPAGKGRELLHVREVEVAHAPAADVAPGRQLLEGGQRLLQRDAAPASAAGRDRASRCRGGAGCPGRRRSCLRSWRGAAAPC